MENSRPDYLKYNENVVRVESTILNIHNRTLETNNGWISINYCLHTHPVKVGDKVMANTKFLKHYPKKINK